MQCEKEGENHVNPLNIRSDSWFSVDLGAERISFSSFSECIIRWSSCLWKNWFVLQKVLWTQQIQCVWSNGSLFDWSNSNGSLFSPLPPSDFHATYGVDILCPRHFGPLFVIGKSGKFDVMILTEHEINHNKIPAKLASNVVFTLRGPTDECCMTRCLLIPSLPPTNIFSPSNLSINPR